MPQTIDSSNPWRTLRDQYILAIKYPTEEEYFPYSGTTYDSLEQVVESACRMLRRYLRARQFDPAVVRASMAELRRRLTQAGPDRYVEIPWPAEYLDDQYGDRHCRELAVVVTLTPKHRTRLLAGADG